MLHETGEGIIKRLLPGKMAEVEIDDFFEVEVPLSELVPISPGEKSLVKPKEAKAKKQQLQTVKAEPELVVFRNQTSDYEVWIVNYGPDLIHYNAFFRQKKSWNSLNTGTVGGGDQGLVHKFRNNEFHQVKSLLFQFMPYPEGEQVRPVQAFNREINPRFDIFDKRPVPVEEFRTDGFRFPLTAKQEVPEAEEKQESPTEKSPVEAPVKRQVITTPLVVDLHVNKLSDNLLGLSAPAILQMQLSHFDKVLSEAVMNGNAELICIHGIGNGKLKKEIHSRLAGNPFVAEYGLAEPVKYGNGATRVVLKVS